MHQRYYGRRLLPVLTFAIYVRGRAFCCCCCLYVLSPFIMDADFFIIIVEQASRKWKETTLDSKKQNVHTQIAAMSAATAHVVSLTSTEEVDSGAVGEAVSAITSGLPDVAKDVRMISALMEEGGGEKLIVATKKLCNAFSDLLTAAEPETKEVKLLKLEASHY